MTHDRVRIAAGDVFVTGRDVEITTVLGSCVAACVRDPVAGIGGMNHFMLPDDAQLDNPISTRYGVHAMELLLGALVRRGALRDRIELKLFGGANALGLSDVGARNAEFALAFAEREGLRVAAHDLAGARGRRLAYRPRSGVALVGYLRDAAEALAGDRRELARVADVGTGSIELFD